MRGRIRFFSVLAAKICVLSTGLLREGAPYSDHTLIDHLYVAIGTVAKDHLI